MLGIPSEAAPAPIVVKALGTIDSVANYPGVVKLDDITVETTLDLGSPNITTHQMGDATRYTLPGALNRVSILFPSEELSFDGVTATVSNDRGDGDHLTLSAWAASAFGAYSCQITQARVDFTDGGASTLQSENLAEAVLDMGAFPEASFTLKQAFFGLPLDACTTFAPAIWDATLTATVDDIHVVPEPSQLFLVAGGLIGLALRARAARGSVEPGRLLA